ncbi:hypothetical protein [Prochlorococcus sp. MIT 1341]|uniref:hypothetical protein n=1 Tax=Prochlorococcus sp. MIT 1341 TaxID=3096221 RepID=UPI002A75384B|nr:hypothetical protein [Prochlorococcus sp. MIT 1341]
MNYTLRLERLRAKVAKLSVAQHPPILRFVKDNAAEAQPNPDDLTEWDLVINVKGKINEPLQALVGRVKQGTHEGGPQCS